jgi:molecular chaperone IbpA
MTGPVNQGPGLRVGPIRHFASEEKMTMRTFDFAPLFRSTVGFDRVTQLLDAVTREETGNGYPPYNIEKTSDDTYRVVMAVAGFGENDITITQHENTLIVAGRQAEQNEPAQFLYRGIAGRAFERRFELADFIRVEGAKLANGLLNIELKREVPEEKKPRSIKVVNAQPQPAQPQLQAAE